MLSEVKALRAGHPLGWREDALGNLAQLTTMPTPRRDLVELRIEAVASLVEPDVVEVARLEGFRSKVFSLDFSPDSRTLATATLRLTKGTSPCLGRCTPAACVAGPRPGGNDPGIPVGRRRVDPSIQARFLPDGRRSGARITWGLIASEFLDSSGRPSARPPIDGGTAQAVGLEVDRQGHRLAVGWDDGRVELRDAATGTLRRSIRDNPRFFALSPDGRWIAFAGPDNAVRIHPTDADGPPVTLGRQRGGIGSLTFSPDGTTLGVASWDHTATLWDVARREERVTLRGHKDRVEGLAFSPDGHWVATSSLDHTTRIWDARTGQTLAVLPGPGMIHIAGEGVQSGRPLPGGVDLRTEDRDRAASASIRSRVVASGDGWSVTAMARSAWPSTPASPAWPREPTITTSSSGTRNRPVSCSAGRPMTSTSPDWHTAPMARCWPPVAAAVGASLSEMSDSGTPRPARYAASSPITGGVSTPWPSTPLANDSPPGMRAES